MVKEEVKIPGTDCILEKGDEIEVLNEDSDEFGDDIDMGGSNQGKEILRKLVQFGKCFRFRVTSKKGHVVATYNNSVCRVKSFGRMLKIFNYAKGIELEIVYIDDVSFNNGVVTITTKDFCKIEIVTNKDSAMAF